MNMELLMIFIDDFSTEEQNETLLITNKMEYRVYKTL